MVDDAVLCGRSGSVCASCRFDQQLTIQAHSPAHTCTASAPPSALHNLGKIGTFGSWRASQPSAPTHHSLGTGLSRRPSKRATLDCDRLRRSNFNVSYEWPHRRPAKESELNCNRRTRVGGIIGISTKGWHHNIFGVSQSQHHFLTDAPSS